MFVIHPLVRARERDVALVDPEVHPGDVGPFVLLEAGRFGPGLAVPSQDERDQTVAVLQARARGPDVAVGAAGEREDLGARLRPRDRPLVAVVAQQGRLDVPIPMREVAQRAELLHGKPAVLRRDAPGDGADRDAARRERRRHGFEAGRSAMEQPDGISDGDRRNEPRLVRRWRPRRRDLESPGKRVLPGKPIDRQARWSIR